MQTRYALGYRQRELEIRRSEANDLETWSVRALNRGGEYENRTICGCRVSLSQRSAPTLLP